MRSPQRFSVSPKLLQAHSSPSRHRADHDPDERSTPVRIRSRHLRRPRSFHWKMQMNSSPLCLPTPDHARRCHCRQPGCVWPLLLLMLGFVLGWWTRGTSPSPSRNLPPSFSLTKDHSFSNAEPGAVTHAARHFAASEIKAGAPLAELRTNASGDRCTHSPQTDNTKNSMKSKN